MLPGRLAALVVLRIGRARPVAWVRSPAVQMVKTTCTESKKKNMTRRDTEAPMGRKSACVESMV